MKAPADWWKNIFDRLYLITDARSVCNSLLTAQEVDLIEQILSLNKDDRILDLCGGYGRHALELARRGYPALTVLDFSDYLIKFGRGLARKARVKIKFLRGDARFSGLKDGGYSAVLVMANSFGYFAREQDNLRILKEIYRLLQKKGRVLIDLTDPDYTQSNLEPFSWHRANKDILVLRQRRLKGCIVQARETVISRKKGLLRDGFYCQRIYKQQRISRLLKKAGFGKLSIKNRLRLHRQKNDYGLMTSRMFVSAVKP